MARVGYSKRVFDYTKYGIKEEIIKSLESDTDIRREMQSIINIANKRVNRLAQGDVISPSLQSLTNQRFTIGGMSWQEAKQEYARAIAFLQQPTSTVTGAKEYGKYIQRAYGLTEEQYKKIGGDITGKLNSIDEQSFYDAYLRTYKDFSGELEQAAQDVAQQIESDAIKLAYAVQDNINNIAEKGEQVVGDVINDILNLFNEFET